MPDPSNILFYLIIFTPGFVSLRVYDLLVPSTKRDFSKSIFEILGYSFFNFAALFWLVIPLFSNSFYNDHRFWFIVFGLITFLIAPSIWPFLWLKLTTFDLVNRFIINPIPKPWDFVFGKKEEFWVLIHLTDGSKIGGRYSGKSFTSSYPSPEQIYIEETWKLSETDAFLEPVERSEGALVSADNIKLIEFYR